MSPRLFLLRVIEPGLELLPSYMVNDQARVALMAIAGQETNWASRVQSNDGPAHGYWQFQKNGVEGVWSAQSGLVAMACATLDISTGDVWLAIQFNDPLACVMARLLLWSDPAALPKIGDVEECWDYYIRNWRPGKPDETRWGPAYATACSTVISNG